MGGALDRANAIDVREVESKDLEKVERMSTGRFAHKNVEVERVVNDAGENLAPELMYKARDFNEGAIARKKELESALKEAKKAMGLTNFELFMDQIRLRRYQAVKFIFLLVVAGCEIDITAFCTAFPTYWTAGIHTDPVMCVFLIIGPLGYLGSLILYAVQNWNEEAQRKAGKKEGGDVLMEADAAPGPAVADRDRHATRRKMLNSALVQKDPVDLKIYHFAPLIRFYLLVKDKSRGDVESVFRVNGLSTFTVGLAQMMCIALGISHGALTWDNLFVQIGMYAQGVNLTVTVLDYLTKTCDTLKTSIEIDNLLYQMKEKNCKELVAYERAIRNAAADPENEELKTQVEDLHLQVEQEIQHICRTALDMNMLPFAEKVAMRKNLEIKLILQRA